MRTCFSNICAMRTCFSNFNKAEMDMLLRCLNCSANICQLCQRRVDYEVRQIWCTIHLFIVFINLQKQQQKYNIGKELVKLILPLSISTAIYMTDLPIMKSLSNNTSVRHLEIRQKGADDRSIGFFSSTSWACT